ncbi:MAG: hypothetical protein HY049_16975 [Acidobacteria bacterium]|nr:hypothetical protein [Acidobacteriota bacterium]
MTHAPHASLPTLGLTVIALPIVFALGVTPAPGATSADFARGFVTGQAYQDGLSESVNLYNFNPVVSVPLSPTYTVSDALSYGLTAYYNAGLRWAMSSDHTHSSYGLSYGNADFNGWLGAGWRLDFGKVVNFIERDSASRCVESASNYLDPGGAFHVISPDVVYTMDGTNTIVTQTARLTKSISACLVPTKLENNDQRWFRTADPNTGQITQIADLTQLNQVNITYYGPSDFDSFTNPAAYDYSSPFAENQEQTRAIKRVTDTRGRVIDMTLDGVAAGARGRMVLSDVAAPVFGDNPASPTGHWTLHYESRSGFTVPDPSWGTLDPNSPPGPFPLLTRIEFPSAGGARLTYTFDYNEHGELSEIRTPGGARTVYEWGDEFVSSDPDADTPSAWPVARVLVRRTVYPSPYDAPGAAHTFTYLHNRYPARCDSNHVVFDKWRALVTDPEGNDTEYRFFTTRSWPYADRPHDYPRNGAPGAVKVYKGHAPRWRAGATGPSERDPGDPGTGLLTRATYSRYMYQDPNWIDWLHVLGTQTIYFDDRLATGFLPLDPNATDPACIANREMDTPVGDSTLEGWAWQAEVHDPNNWFSHQTVNGREYKRTYIGNLVGPRELEIQGEGLDLCPLRPQFGEFRTIKEGGVLKELSQTGNGGICIRRNDLTRSYDYADRGVLYSRDIAQTPTWTAGMLTAIAHSGGDPVSADPNAMGNAPVTYTESLGYNAGALSSRKFAGVSWYSLDRTIDPASGLPAVSRDSAGVATTLGYDALGRTVSVAPLSPEMATMFVYSAETRSFTDAGGVTNTHVFSRSVEVNRGDFLGSSSGIYAKYEYDGLGRLVRETRGKPNGALMEQTRAYDGLGAPTFTSVWHNPGLSGTGTTISYRDGDASYPPSGRREPFGRPMKVTNAVGNARTYSYFGLNDRVTDYNVNVPPNQQTSPTDPSHAATTTTYRDHRGHVRIVSPPIDPITQAPAAAPAVYAYNYGGRLTAVKLLQSLAMQAYDVADPNTPDLRSDRFAIVPSAGFVQTRAFVHDNLGLLRETVEPETGHTWNRAYDPLGNPTVFQDNGMRATRLSYDPAGRLIESEVAIPDSSYRIRALYTYANDPGSIGAHGTALSKLVRAETREGRGASAAVEREFFYGGVGGRLSQERDRYGSFWGGATPWLTTSYVFDNFGLPSRLTYPIPDASPRVPTAIAYRYAHGYLTEIDSNKGTGDPNVLTPMAIVGYNPRAVPSSLTYSNGVTERFSSDILGRPTGVTVQAGASGWWDSGAYRFDGAGNLVGIGLQNYAYDPVGRLVGSTTATMDAFPMYYSQSFGYDRYGSMTARTGSLGGSQTFDVDPNTNRVRALNPASANLRFEYDPVGSVTTDGVYDYEHDDRERLTRVRLKSSSVDVDSYGYDERGWRVRKTDSATDRTTAYVRDLDGHVLSEYAMPAGTSLEPHWKKDYVHALGRHLAAIENIEPDEPSGEISSASRAGATPSVTLAWLPVPSADIYGYHVYRSSAGPTGPYVRLTASAPVTSTTFTDTSVAPGAPYYYELTSVDMSGNESPETPPRKITPGDATPPSAPSQFTGSTEDGVALTWTAAADSGGDLAGQRLYRNPTGVALSPLGGLLPAGASSYLDSTAVPGTEYVYEIRSVDTAGLESGPNPQVTLTPTAPGGGTGGAGGSCGEHCMPGKDSLLLPRYPAPSLPGEAFEDLADPASVEGDYRIVFYHVDHLGTPRVLTDEMGDVVGEYALFPFGEEVPGPWPIAASSNTHWFTGHERDLGVGADDMLARTFHPASGRFLAADPSLRNVNLRSPGTLDGYAYVNGSPMDTLDPDGMASLRCRPLNTVLGLHVGSPDSRSLMHTSFFYDDGASPPNSGFFPGGVGPDRPDELKYYGAPVQNHLNDTLLRQAELLVRATGKFDAEDYSLSSNNCHDYAGAVLDAYMRLAHGRKLLNDCRDQRDVDACRKLERSCHLKEVPEDVCQQYEDARRQGALPAHQFIVPGSIPGAQR